MKFGIIAKTHKKEFAGKLREAVAWLQNRDCQVVIERGTADSFGLKCPVADRESLPREADILIVFGGDGTILSVARLMRDATTPLLAVNLGSLGFLTEVTLEELYPALERIIGGEHRVNRRGMLKVEVRKNGKAPEYHHVLNDAVINKGALARIIAMDTFVDDNFVAQFLADGLIISTPTGSTAYSLSAGGPILFPSIESTVITPICPHTLTNRPVVVPAESRIQVVLRSGDDVMLTLDGQIGLPLREGDAVVCTRSEYNINLIIPGEKSFFDVLRKKLKWGER
ncbi:MAG: NAD(+)/NADH kinase [Acidobacteria bacterium]|nr:NAD(+)/NADH kinase [Acidobacteriota bacterium]